MHVEYQVSEDENSKLPMKATIQFDDEHVQSNRCKSGDAENTPDRLIKIPRQHKVAAEFAKRLKEQKQRLQELTKQLNALTQDLIAVRKETERIKTESSRRFPVFPVLH